jgi:hypothetical protein
VWNQLAVQSRGNIVCKLQSDPHPAVQRAVCQNLGLQARFVFERRRIPTHLNIKETMSRTSSKLN